MTDKNFFRSLPYFIIISIGTLAFWYFGREDIGMIAYASIIFILMLALRNTLHTIPFLFNLLFMISQTEWDMTQIPLYLYYLPMALVLGMIAHSLIYKTSIFKGKFFLGIAWLAVVAIISTAINDFAFDLNVLIILVVVIFLVILYGFYANSLECDNSLYLIKLMVVLGSLIATQVGLFYLNPEVDIQYALEHKTLNLGWGISNFVATYLIMFISATVYFVKKNKLHIVWIVIMLFEVGMLLFTLSRAGIIAFILTSVLLVIYMFVGYEKKWNLFLNLVIGTILVSAVAYLFRDYFITIWDRLELFGLDDNGRIDIWIDGWTKFKENLIYGAGVFTREVDDGLRMYHNTVLNILAWFGILGGIALLIQFYSLLRIFFYKFNSQKAILLIALIGVNLQGMVDNIYMMPQYMIIMFVMVAVVENANKIDRLRSELQVK